MLLDASRSHDIGILVESRDKGHKGLPRFEVSGSQEKLRAVKPSRGHPGNIGESHDWLSLSLKVSIASRVGCVSFFSSLPTAQIAGLPLPVPIQVRNPRPAAWKSQKIPEVCIRVLILPDNHDFAGSIRAGS